MSITDQPKTSHPTRTAVIAGMCVALAAGAALAVATWGGQDTDSPAPEQPSYAEQVAALSDEELAAAFNYTNYPIYVQVAALSDEELAGAFNYTRYDFDEPSEAEQIAALSDEELAGAFNYTRYDFDEPSEAEQIAALSDEELAGAFNYTRYDFDEPSEAEQIAALSDDLVTPTDPAGGPTVRPRH